MPTKATEGEIAALKAESLVKYWMSEIDHALAREKKYREKAQKVVDIYEGKRADETPFAIIYSNTETLTPALYNARPIPIVTRRFKDADPIGKAAAETSTRLLKFLIDTEDQDYDSFDDLTQAAVLDAAITNRGLMRFKYVAHENNYNAECVYGESVRWDKFFHGYARTWKKVPWIGFEWDMSQDDLKKNFPDAQLDFKQMATNEADNTNNKAENRDELEGVTTYKVYEIWDKKTRRVMFFSWCARKEPLRVVNDPLELVGFFPIPRPLNFTKKITTLIPTPLYEQYRQQAQELNDITRRLKAIIKAIKFRGAYNSTVEGIEKVLTADDNELVPVENLASMPEGTTMDKLIWTVPVNDLVQAAQSLYQQREQVKSVIYEITGISDILRGASVASETATAQNIKNQWGTLRLKKMQKEVQRYCREALSIMLEIAAKKFELQTIQQMTGLPFLTAQQKAMLQFQMQQQQQPMMPGQPPQAPQLPLEVQTAMASPSWEDILNVFHNDVIRSYKTDIETNSTIDAEAAQDKQDISELLNAVSQFLNGVAPLVENGTLSLEVAKSMLLVVSRRFNFGSQLEEALNSMKAPEPQKDPVVDAKAQAEQAKAGAEQAKAQAEMAQIKLEAQVSQQEFENKKNLMSLEAQIKQAELEIKREELRLQQVGLANKAAFQAEQHRIKMAGIAAKERESDAVV